MECPLWCLLSDRRRHVEHLWRRRLLVTADERRARRRFLRLMRGFDTEDVDVLRRAIESEGRDARQCAPGPPMEEREDESRGGGGEDSGLIPQIDRPMSMPYLCCKLWRWRELQVDAALHSLDSLPWCRFGRVTINNATVSCCNPYHYALWIRADSMDESHTLNGGIASGEGPKEEEKVPVMTPSEDIPLCAPPPPPEDKEGIEEGDMESPPSTSSRHSIHRCVSAWAEVQRWEKGDKIGEGVILSGHFAAIGMLANTVHDAQPVHCEWDTRNDVSFALIRQATEDVWLYNSGTRSLFVSVVSGNRADALRRLSPGYCVRVFKGRPGTGDSTRRASVQSVSTPPYQQSHAIISVGAGWGTGYDRLCASETRVRYHVSFVS
ncbi:hypothetical protein PFISCL1PPCAC_19789 [Pristionchus fissidentatus]|uniref:MH1 domain-containing protein n=1 Tax=Pristionchus fissidentatus TaxID=1538716 RepID=A0AAV5W9K0_9BILA|nr:hypothetical protein PFISCL1PPCAC_19789 [Pristionchus fissidentatus]